jgi:hypothetical protein
MASLVCLNSSQPSAHITPSQYSARLAGKRSRDPGPARGSRPFAGPGGCRLRQRRPPVSLPTLGSVPRTSRARAAFRVWNSPLSTARTAFTLNEAKRF